jgi:hypothetical protein
LFYGKKMRKLRVIPWEQNAISLIHPSVFRIISVFLDLFHPGRLVLPHLRELFCHSTQLDSIWDIIAYLSPSLQKIELDAGYVGPDNLPPLALLSTLASKSPFVKQLYVIGYTYSTTNNPSILSTFPCGFLHLSSFICPGFPISCDAITHLANLPNICDISLYFSDSYASGLSTLVMPATMFPSLRDLTLTGTCFASGIEFIRVCLRSVSLKSVFVGAENNASPGEIHGLFSALSSRLLVQSLTSVRLIFPYHESDEGDQEAPALESSDFEPLLLFTNLEKLLLETTSSAENLSDDLLDAISLAWPRLTHLCFDFSFSQPSQCTFNGILVLAKRCPRLYSLRIPFMASTQISWNDRPRAGIANQSLKSLDVGRSLIGDPRMVASLLSAIFPNLESIDAWDDYNTAIAEDVQTHNQWKEVIVLYKRFAEIRKERPLATHQEHN